MCRVSRQFGGRDYDMDFQILCGPLSLNYVVCSDIDMFFSSLYSIL